MPMRILTEVHLARLYTIDAKDSSEDEIAETLALVAKRRARANESHRSQEMRGDNRRIDSFKDVMDW